MSNIDKTDDQRAEERGEIRVASSEVRGRVYEKREMVNPDSGKTVIVMSEPLANLEMKIIRANGDVETYVEKKQNIFRRALKWLTSIQP
jgi:hypothetical protein